MTEVNPHRGIFSLAKGRSALFGFAVKPLERLLGLRKLEDAYHKSLCELAKKSGDVNFWENWLDVFNIGCGIDDACFERIPKTGSLVVVANHPFGGIEGMVLASILLRVRPDVKLLVNYLLSTVPELRPYLFNVDPFGTRQAIRKNANALKQSVDWVLDGGVLVVFPAGEVASYNFASKSVIDPKWQTSVAKIIRKTKAHVLPVHFDGQNGWLFQIMGMIHPRLRTAMLVRELLNKQDKNIRVRVGTPIAYSRLEKIEDDEKLLLYLRVRTHILANRETRIADNITDEVLPEEEMQEVIPPVDPAVMESELSALDEKHFLVDSDDYRVIWAHADKIPMVLREIGRLREITFRGVGEGTGKSIDLDEFDDYYIHLFIWQKAKKEIVGAYRLARTDEVLPKYGKKGLYTKTLFRYKSPLLKMISPAIELGRSFVRDEYQRSYSPLMLLWKGIGSYIVQHPECKNLFGPVSISNRYQSFTRKLMMEFLKANNFGEDICRMVKSKFPLQHYPVRYWNKEETLSCISSMEDLSEIVAEIETEHKEVPILLKQYLKLGGRLVGFNVDPDFNNVLDGLIFVDVTKAPGRIMQRYMGKQGLKDFMEFHSR